MHQVLISLASNYQQEKNLSEARLRLGQVLSSLSFTSEIWTDPVGGSHRSDKYLNQLAKAETPMAIDCLYQQLKEIEADMGRTAEARRSGIVGIDLDLLQYDGERYHLRDWDRDYVKLLLNRFP